MVRPKAKRLADHHLLERFSVSERRVVTVLGLARSTMRYKPRPSRDVALEERMKALATHHRRFGLPRLHYLLRREGAVIARSRTERIYSKLGLQLQKRRRKKMVPVTRTRFKQASSPNEIWSFDFVSDPVNPLIPDNLY